MRKRSSVLEKLNASLDKIASADGDPQAQNLVGAVRAALKEAEPSRRIYAVTSSMGEKVIVKQGIKGYYKVGIGGYNGMTGAEWTRLAMKQTPAETAAALAGSIFGWDCPGADPSNYNDEGKAISHRKEVKS